jgi:hypothetical protein
MNGSSQWSYKKLQEMLNILNQKIINNPMNFELKPKIKKKNVKVIKSIINNTEYYNCTTCNEVKPETEFIKTICKKCRTLKLKQNRITPRVTLQNLLSHAKYHTKIRQNKKTINHDNEFDIDYDFLVEIFNKQKGLCAYSGIPLQFGSYLENNWIISLERIDTSKGYVKTNICLICQEFNTCNNSIRFTTKKNENGGWSVEKFKIILESCRNFYQGEF